MLSRSTSVVTQVSHFMFKLDTPVPMVDHPHHILDPTIHYIKGCRSINKQFSIDSFFDLEGHHWVWISTRSFSLDHHITLATIALMLVSPNQQKIY